MVPWEGRREGEEILGPSGQACHHRRLGGQGPAEMLGPAETLRGRSRIEIQLSLRLSVSQTITDILHYSHSDFNKTTKQKIGPPAATNGITTEEPQQNPVLVFYIFHNPHAKESASTTLDHPCTSR